MKVRFYDTDGNIEKEYDLETNEDKRAFFEGLKDLGPFAPPIVESNDADRE